LRGVWVLKTMLFPWVYSQLCAFFQVTYGNSSFFGVEEKMGGGEELGKERKLKEGEDNGGWGSEE